jgi:peptide/nickel transport system substrate-binding protein
MKISHPAAVLAALAIAVGLAGCGGSSDESGGSTEATKDLVIETPAPTGEAGAITWAVYRETNSLDPIFAFDYPENTALYTMCESLLRQQPDGTIVPGLASEMTNPDPTTYAITVRDGVKFWDGSPLTADDIVYSLGRVRDAKLGGFYAAVFSRVTSITATSPTEVTIKLSEPDYWLRGELASTPGLIYEKAYAEKQGKNFGTVNGGTMCTGPFKLDSWKTGQGITVVKNDAYWDDSLAPQVKQISIIGSSDDATVTSALETGEIDGYYALQLTTLDQLKQSPDVNVYEGPAYASDAFIVSSLKGTLGDVRVRRALSMAIDRPGLLATTYKGAAQLPRTLTNPGTWGYAKDVFQQAWDDLSEPTVDVEGAKKLIEEAGATGKTVRIGTSAELPGLNTEASAIKSAAESIGLKATLVSLSAANYINFFIDPKVRATVDGFLTINYPDYADPAGLYATLVLPDGSQNYSGYSNPKVTAAMEAARGEADDTKRAEDVTQAQKLIMQDLPWIPVLLPSQVLAMHSNITGAPASFQYMFGPWAAQIGAAD